MIGILIVAALYISLFIYEMGHIIAVKINKLNVKKIVVGFGPQLICIRGKRTEYILKSVPLGSYTELNGDEENDEKHKGYNEISCIKKVFTIASGIIISFVVMIILQVILGSMENLGSNIGESFRLGVVYSTDFISDFYKAIYEMAVTRNITLGTYIKIIISNGEIMLGMGPAFFMYILSCILGIIISINILPLPIFSGGQVILQIFKGVFKIEISESKISMFNIITFIISILFLIYIII